MSSPVAYNGWVKRKWLIQRPVRESWLAKLPGFFDLGVSISSSFDGVSCRQLTWMLPAALARRVLSVTVTLDPLDPPPKSLSILGHGLFAPFAFSPHLGRVSIFGVAFYDFGDLIPVKRSLKDLLISDSSVLDLESVQQGPYVTAPHTIENVLRCFHGLRSLSLRRCHENSWEELTANADLLAVEELKVAFRQYSGSVKLQFSLAAKAPETLKSLSLTSAGLKRLSTSRVMKNLEYLCLENLEIEDPYELKEFLMCCPELKQVRIKNAFSKDANPAAKAAFDVYLKRLVSDLKKQRR
eukprot:TRINITY_DN6079_c0_g2_i1.p1 TRINITY_DN6079_c0_g2~~TRINITY_DN6079_c0_g2_i1.p1  ORF type:complete len:297 (+),score=53.65 TRINITY_DN6079_c0_g2_i1:96-986(+)